MCRALGDEEKLAKVPEKASERERVSQGLSKEGLPRTKWANDRVYFAKGTGR